MAFGACNAQPVTGVKGAARSVVPSVEGVLSLDRHLAVRLVFINWTSPCRRQDVWVIVHLAGEGKDKAVLEIKQSCSLYIHS